MMSLDHCEGFEREALFHQVLARALRDCPAMKARTVRQMLRMVAPEFVEGLFGRRPCVRILRYIGRPSGEDAPGAVAPRLRLNRTYRSRDFNGATYTLEGGEEGGAVVGYAYFQRIT